MKPEMMYLLFTAILTGCLWIPVVIGYVVARGPLKPEDYKVAPTSPLPDWVNRANRAHINAVENFGPFAAVVLIGHALSISTPVTQIAAAVFFFGRALHAVIQINGVTVLMARTIVFTVTWMAFMAFAIEVLRHAMTAGAV